MAQAKIRMIPSRRAGITSLPALTLPAKTSATFVAGAPIKHASGVLAAISTTSSSSVLYAKKSSAAAYALAMGTTIASSTNSIACARFTEGMEFQGNLVDASASSAKAAATNLGSYAYLAKISGDTHWGWSLNAPASSVASYIRGKVTQLVDAASTVNGRVVVGITTGGALSV